MEMTGWVVDKMMTWRTEETVKLFPSTDDLSATEHD